MDDQKSDNALIEFGVPQGSVLGPLIYINDLNQAIKFSRVHHFADNTNLLLTDNSLKKINILTLIENFSLYGSVQIESWHHWGS